MSDVAVKLRRHPAMEKSSKNRLPLNRPRIGLLIRISSLESTKKTAISEKTKFKHPNAMPSFNEYASASWSLISGLAVEMALRKKVEYRNPSVFIPLSG